MTTTLIGHTTTLQEHVVIGLNSPSVADAFVKAIGVVRDRLGCDSRFESPMRIVAVRRIGGGEARAQQLDPSLGMWFAVEVEVQLKPALRP
jgi:hypothetical protein